MTRMLTTLNDSNSTGIYTREKCRRKSRKKYSNCESINLECLTTLNHQFLFASFKCQRPRRRIDAEIRRLLLDLLCFRRAWQKYHNRRLRYCTYLLLCSLKSDFSVRILLLCPCLVCLILNFLIARKLLDESQIDLALFDLTPMSEIGAKLYNLLKMECSGSKVLQT